MIEGRQTDRAGRPSAGRTGRKRHRRRTGPGSRRRLEARGRPVPAGRRKKHARRPAGRARTVPRTGNRPGRRPGSRDTGMARKVGSTLLILAGAAAAALLIAVFLLPVYRIYGDSMSPTLKEGDIVVTVKEAGLEQGDLVVFQYDNKILVKRYIAGPGQQVDIGEDGSVTVDGELLEEPYLEEKALGECDIELPYRVPEGRIFVMGDHRSTSVDSRSSTVGCVTEEQLAGKIVFRIWPLSGIGTTEQKGW